MASSTASQGKSKACPYVCECEGIDRALTRVQKVNNAGEDTGGGRKYTNAGQTGPTAMSLPAGEASIAECGTPDIDGGLQCAQGGVTGDQEVDNMISGVGSNSIMLPPPVPVLQVSFATQPFHWISLIKYPEQHRKEASIPAAASAQVGAEAPSAAPDVSLRWRCC